MVNSLACPCCGDRNVIRVQAPGRVGETTDPADSRAWLVHLGILLLALTIVGLPFAAWICKRLDQNAVEARDAFRCRACGHLWTPDEERVLRPAAYPHAASEALQP